MAININPGSPLRHVSSFTSSGTWTAPLGATRAFVSVHGATGGQSGGRRYNYAGASGIAPVSGGWVQITPGAGHGVTIGAAGSGGANGPSATGGSSGGTTTFDGAITITGSQGGQVGSDGANGSSSATTSLTTINPGGSTIVRVTDYTTQTSGGAQTPGVGNGRYSQSGGASGVASGIVHIYI